MPIAFSTWRFTSATLTRIFTWFGVATAIRFETVPFVSFAIAVARPLTVAAWPALATVPPSTRALSTELTVTFSPGAMRVD